MTGATVSVQPGCAAAGSGAHVAHDGGALGEPDVLVVLADALRKGLAIVDLASFWYNFQIITGDRWDMSAPSLEAKKAYFARVRRRNYLASLRLEGFRVKEGPARHASRKAAVAAYSRKAKAGA